MGKKRKTKLVPRTTEFATPERMRQEGGVTVEPVDRNLRGDVVQVRHKAKLTCKLDWYRDAGSITQQMWEAGCKFARLYFMAGKMPRTTPMYGDFVQGRRGHDPLAGKTDAQTGLEEALAVLDSAEQDVVWDVCGNDQYAAGHRRLRALQTGLRALSVHWN